MITDVILKVFSDLGFYLSAAGVVGAAFGARSAPLIVGWFALTAAGVLAWLLQSRGVWRFLPPAAAAAFFVLTHYARAEAAVLLPAFAYVVYLAAARRFETDRDIERQLFSVLWKLLIAVTLIGLIAGVGQYISHIALPIGLVSLLCQILLLRGMRHEPEVRRRPRYQLSELLLAAAVSAVILFLGSETGVRLIGAGLKGIYFGVIYPVLELLVSAATFLFSGVAWLVSRIWQLLHVEHNSQTVVETPPYWESDRRLYLGEGQSVTAPRKAIVALIILLAAVLLFFLFRWMSRRPKGKREDTPGVTDERSTEKPPEAAVSARERGAVAHVRAAYRRYLRLGAEKGIRCRKTDTTLDIRNRFSGRFPDGSSDALRELYLRARYDGHADREDAVRARELLALLKDGAED